MPSSTPQFSHRRVPDPSSHPSPRAFIIAHELHCNPNTRPFRASPSPSAPDASGCHRNRKHPGLPQPHLPLIHPCCSPNPIANLLGILHNTLTADKKSLNRLLHLSRPLPPRPNPPPLSLKHVCDWISKSTDMHSLETLLRPFPAFPSCRIREKPKENHTTPQNLHGGKPLIGSQ
ncbi:unnamed protein product [Periconia digitata]|uniref:Uncharacterized protein n=1 Tax=Periconia digitata TaxID=1303443 RepID=A0A9W4XYC6_9PLEO|nr:unnamed protein product [Periconia digitata]